MVKRFSKKSQSALKKGYGIYYIGRKPKTLAKKRVSRLFNAAKRVGGSKAQRAIDRSRRSANHMTLSKWKVGRNYKRGDLVTTRKVRGVRRKVYVTGR